MGTKKGGNKTRKEGKKKRREGMKGQLKTTAEVQQYKWTSPIPKV